MPIMERAGSRSARNITYQCPQCHHTVDVDLGKPGDRTYNSRIPCPRCTHIHAGSPPVDSQPEMSYTPK